MPVLNHRRSEGYGPFLHPPTATRKGNPLMSFFRYVMIILAFFVLYMMIIVFV